MRKGKLAFFLVLSLVLSVSLPALVIGQSAPSPGGTDPGTKDPGTKPTPVATATPTPVVGDDDGDEVLEGCLGAMAYLCNFGGYHHRHHSRFDNRGGCGRD